MNLDKVRKHVKFKVVVSIVSMALPFVIVPVLEVLSNILNR